MRLICTACLLTLGFLPAFAQGATPALIEGAVRLTLPEALWRDSPVTDLAGLRHDKPDLVLDLVCSDRQWKPEVWGYARWYNRADHEGRVVEAKTTDTATQLKIHLAVNPDQWIAGGEAEYTISLQRNGEGLSGSFTGTFNGKDVHGSVVGTINPVSLTAGREPWTFKGGEHPRLLFTKADLPKLRDRTKSDLWPKLVSAMEKDWKLSENGFGYGMFQNKPQAMQGTQGLHAASHGFYYQMTGDRSHADRARELTKACLTLGHAQDEIWGNVGVIQGVALAYDFCFDAWDEPFKREVRAWLIRWASNTTRPRGLRPQGSQSLTWVNFNPYSSDLVAFRAAGGVAALAVLGDFTAEEKTPATEPITITPDATFRPGKDVPVVAFTNDSVVTQWLNMSGLVEDPAWRPGIAEMQKDPLASLGGPEKLRPERGTKATYRDTTAVFEPLDPKYVFTDVYTDGRPAVALLRPVHDKSQSIDYYYTVLKNDQPRLLRLDLGDRYIWAEKIWINGTPVAENQVFQLEKGEFPVLIQARVPTKQTYSPYFPAFYGNTQYPHRDGRRGNWHYQALVLDDGIVQQFPKADLWMMPRFIESPDPRKDPAAYAYIKPGEVLDPARIAAIAARTVSRYFDAAWSQRGWGPEDECDGDAIQYVLYFLQSYRATTGLSLPQAHAVESILPVLVQRDDLGSEYGRAQFVAAGFAPARDQSLVRHMLDQAIARWEKSDWMQFPEFAVYTMLNYPLDAAPKSPAELRMPLNFEDKVSGGCVWRKSWNNGADDFLLVTRGSSKAIHNASLAGSFAIRGFGTWWSKRWAPEEGVITYPFPGQHNVVTLENTLPMGGAELVSTEFTPNGSGTATYNMDKVYWGARPAKTNITAMLNRNNGSLGLGVDWGDATPFDAGIKAIRCIAADFSGISGAPALFVVIDKFTGADGVAKVWHMEAAGVADRKPTKTMEVGDTFFQVLERTRDPKAAKRDDNGLAPKPIQAGEKHLRVTFVGTPDLKLSAKKGRIEGASNGPGFFVVLTLQDGPAPQVKVEGHGLDAKVTIGKRKVVFDGQKIILGE